MNYESGCVRNVGRIAEEIKRANPQENGLGKDMAQIVLDHCKKVPQMSDRLRAIQLGMSTSTVLKWRKHFGIEPYTEKRCHQCGAVKPAANKVFEIVDYGDGYSDVCVRCLGRPDEWHNKVNQLFKRAGW